MKNQSQPSHDEVQISARLCQKLRLLGPPYELDVKELDQLVHSPSLRIQGFLHWFMNVLSPSQSLANHFDPNDLDKLTSLEVLNGDKLVEKETFQRIDDDEANLLAEISRLENKLARESQKQIFLQQHLVTSREQLDSLHPRQRIEFDKNASQLNSIEHILNQLNADSNAFGLGVLNPNTCVELCTEEDSILDAAQTQLMPYFRKTTPAKQLEVILESPNHSNDVIWLHKLLENSEETFEDHEIWLEEVQSWQDSYMRMEIDVLNGIMQLAELKALQQPQKLSQYEPSQRYVHQLTRQDKLPVVQEKIECILDDKLPALLEDLAVAYSSSVVLGNYPEKYNEQERHKNSLRQVLGTLEQQAARLELMALVLKSEMEKIIELRDTIHGLLQDMQTEVQDGITRRAEASLNTVESTTTPPEHYLADPEISKLEEMRSLLREDWRTLASAYSQTVNELFDEMKNAPTLIPQLEEISKLKDTIETGIARIYQVVQSTNELESSDE